MGKLNDFKIMGIKLPMYLIMFVIVAFAMGTGGLGSDVLSTMVYLAILGGILYEIGDRIPIFNKWIGGGAMLAIMFPSWMVYMDMIPEQYVESAVLFYDTISWQTLYICMLMAGSLLMIERKTLIRSLVRYIPTVCAGIVTAAIFGIGAGMIMGYSIPELMTFYVLPIMGGGNGAGAIPMSQIYEQVTGGNKDGYYSAALAILTLANTLCIIVGALLNGIGNKLKWSTGDGTQLMRKSAGDDGGDKEDELPKATMSDIASTIGYVGVIYAVSLIFAKVLLPDIAGIPIHQYAYFVVFLALANIFKLIPLENKSGIKTFTRFISRPLGAMGFAGIGIVMTDWGEFVGAISLQNLVICLAVVIGAVVGTAICGWFVGFYPVDSAITAGLCMANRGGGGDLVVLGAANRMELMSYAAISSRLGGGLVLVLAGIVFSILY